MAETAQGRGKNRAAWRGRLLRRAEGGGAALHIVMESGEIKDGGGVARDPNGLPTAVADDWE